VGSGLIATFFAMRHPTKIRHIALPDQLHDHAALPLALLLAFRFQNAYDRWWTSRHSSEDLASSISSLAACAGGGIAEVHLSTEAEVDFLQRRLLLLCELFACAAEEKIHGAGVHGHPANGCPQWTTLEETLQDWPEGAAGCLASPDRVVWCSTQMVWCIDRLEDLKAFGSGRAGHMHGMLGAMQQALDKCLVVCHQKSPAPFVVHLRTILLLFCATYPFTIITTVPPLLIVPAQSIVSFAFLGSEYCSQEMEHPFGDDKADIPVRQILMRARLSARAARQNLVARGARIPT